MGSLRLTLLRHGHAQPADAGPADFERSLTRRGAREARTMAGRLLHRGLIPDLILASPANRAWTTATIVAQTCSLDEAQLQCAEDLYLATAQTIWRLIGRERSVPHVLVCAHNPGLSEVASLLGPRPQPRALPTAGLASALWHDASWSLLEPHSAASCEFDAPAA